MNETVIWNKVLDNLKNKFATASYDAWFAPTELYKLQDNKATIVVPLPMHKTHLNKYTDIITNLLYEYTNVNYDLVFLLKEEIEVEEEVKLEEDIKNTLEIKEEKHVSNLNPNYTFDNFIVGNSNRFAHAAAVSVAENPGVMYNPLFLYGNSGVGKTHLMHSIGNYIEEHSDKKVLYVTSQDFIDEIRKMNRKDKDGTNFSYLDLFKGKYRNIDILIIDDIQSLGGAQKSQEEFFHTFTNLFNSQKQIIIASDRSPDDLKMLEERLTTRFVWGLTVDISPPDYNLKINIIKNKIKALDINEDIPEEVIEYIATNIGPDVRHLEGAITRLVAYATMWGKKDITLDLAIDALKDHVCKGIGEKNDIHRIQKIVAEHFQISVEDLRSKKRSAIISRPRQIACYLCRNLTDESTTKIGIEFGGKDHTSIMYASEKIQKEILENRDLANLIEKLKKDIGIVK